MHSASNPLPLANEHFAQLYRSESELVDAVSAYAMDVLSYSGQAMLFVATRHHCEAFRRALMVNDVDVGGAIAQGRITFLRAEDILPRLMAKEGPQRAVLKELLEREFRRIRGAGHRHVHVFGELVNLLWSSGQTAATHTLEQLWNEMKAKESFTLYCGYQVSQPAMDVLNGDLRSAVCEHNAIMKEVSDRGFGHRRVFVDLPSLARIAPGRTTLVGARTSVALAAPTPPLAGEPQRAPAPPSL